MPVKMYKFYVGKDYTCYIYRWLFTDDFNYSWQLDVVYQTDNATNDLWRTNLNLAKGEEFNLDHAFLPVG